MFSSIVLPDALPLLAKNKKKHTHVKNIILFHPNLYFIRFNNLNDKLWIITN